MRASSLIKQEKVEKFGVEEKSRKVDADERDATAAVNKAERR